MKIIIVVIVSIILTSCNAPKEETKQLLNSENKVILKYIRDIDLKLDEKTPNWTTKSQYIFDKILGKEFIIFLNEPNNSLQFYNLTGEKIKEIVFSKEGPEATGIIQGFLYHSEDSLFILNYRTFKIFNTTSTGKILRTYQLPLYSQSRYFTIPWVVDGTEMCYKDNHLFIPGNVGIEYEKHREAYYENGLLNISLNIISNETLYQISYPNKSDLIIKDYTTKGLNPKCVYNSDQNELLYSFGVDHKIYNYSLNGKLIGKHFFGSQFADDKIAELSNRQEFGDPIREALYYLNNLFYENVYYDSYRKLYYRIVKHKLKEEFTFKDFQKGKKPDFRCSMIIADQKFTILGEILLDKGIGMGTFLITKDGILIHDNNSQNEDNMSFRYYEIVKI